MCSGPLGCLENSVNSCVPRVGHSTWHLQACGKDGYPGPTVSISARGLLERVLDVAGRATVIHIFTVCAVYVFE